MEYEKFVKAVNSFLCQENCLRLCDQFGQEATGAALAQIKARAQELALQIILYQEDGSWAAIQMMQFAGMVKAGLLAQQARPHIDRNPASLSRGPCGRGIS